MGFFSRAKALSNVKDASGVNLLRGMVENAFGMCEAMDEIAPGLNIRETYVQDVVSFCLLVASSDGKVTKDETGMLSMILGVDISHYQAKTAAKELFEKGKDEYMSTIPLSFMLLAQVIDKINMPDADPAILVDLYAKLGAYMSMADGEISESEAEAIKDYVLMLIDYVKTIQ